MIAARFNSVIAFAISSRRARRVVVKHAATTRADIPTRGGAVHSF